LEKKDTSPPPELYCCCSKSNSLISKAANPLLLREVAVCVFGFEFLDYVRFSISKSDLINISSGLLA